MIRSLMGSVVSSLSTAPAENDIRKIQQALSLQFNPLNLLIIGAPDADIGRKSV